MVDINLLPPSQKQKRRALGLVTYVTIGFIIIMILLVGFAITLTTVKFTINEKADKYSTEITSLKKQIAEYQSLEKDIVQTNRTLALVGTILSKQLGPLIILDGVSSRIGPNLTLTAISVGPKDLKNTAASTDLQISITGEAGERAHVIDFKRALELDTRYRDITYTISNAASTAGSASTQKSSYTFTITATFSKTAEKK